MSNSKLDKLSTEALVNSSGIYGGANGSDKTYADSYNEATHSYDTAEMSLIDVKDSKYEDDKPGL